jgi:Tfp pilus assembly protein PilN
MPAKNSPPSTINFLPGSRLEDSQTGRVLKWLLSTFRIIVIMVQIVVVIVFATRVFIDLRVVDLNKKIEGKYALVSSYSNIESEFLNKQLRLNTFQSLQSEENSYVTILRAVAESTPVNVKLLSVQKIAGGLIIKGETQSDSSIASFTSKLEDTTLITNVQVTELLDKIVKPTEFTINANVSTLVQTTDPSI